MPSLDWALRSAQVEMTTRLQMEISRRSERERSVPSPYLSLRQGIRLAKNPTGRGTGCGEKGVARRFAGLREGGLWNENAPARLT